MTGRPPAINRPQAVFLGLLAARRLPQVMQRNIGRFADQLQLFPQTDYYKIFEAAVRLWRQTPQAGVGTRYYTRPVVSTITCPISRAAPCTPTTSVWNG
jgi:hypothetical protein